MAELTIRLVVDPKTKKKNILIDYTSEEDALPMEHEDAHRELVNKLIEGGALEAAELGEIIVTREGETAPGATDDRREGEATRQAQEQGDG